MAEKFHVFTPTVLPDHLKGWGACRIANGYLITRLDRVIATISGPKDRENKLERREIEHTARAMENAPALLVALEHLVSQLESGQKPDLEHAHAAISLVRLLPVFTLDEDLTER